MTVLLMNDEASTESLAQITSIFCVPKAVACSTHSIKSVTWTSLWVNPKRASPIQVWGNYIWRRYASESISPGFNGRLGYQQAGWGVQCLGRKLKEISGKTLDTIRKLFKYKEMRQISRSEMPVNSSLEKIFANTIQPFKILI